MWGERGYGRWDLMLTVMNRPLSRCGHFVSGDLKSFVLNARLVLYTEQGLPCMTKDF